MRKATMIASGIALLSLATFAHPFEGNTYGFCPIFKSPLHTANNVVVAARHRLSRSTVLRSDVWQPDLTTRSPRQNEAA